MGRAEYKVPGGKLIRVRVETKGGRISNIKITGDFFLHPETDLEELERDLLGLKADQRSVRETVSVFFRERKTLLLGVCPEDFVKVIILAIKN